jgi:hypothetical protein
MEKHTGNVLKFNEFRQDVSNIRILAQSLVDKKVHPDDYKNGKMKNELINEYNRIKNIQINDLLGKLNRNQIKQLKHFLNIRTSESSNIKKYISTYNYKKLDKLYIFLLELSTNKITLKFYKGKSKKIRMKMGPHRKTRKKR